MTLETESVENRLEIRCRDSGPGIPKEEMDRIFEPLFSTKGFGVGLGLPIVRNILKQHGGDVEIWSEPGKGARVILWLPIEPASESNCSDETTEISGS
jgi:signal transduction histidine kinase